MWYYGAGQQHIFKREKCGVCCWDCAAPPTLLILPHPKLLMPGRRGRESRRQEVVAAEMGQGLTGSWSQQSLLAMSCHPRLRMSHDVSTVSAAVNASVCRQHLSLQRAASLYCTQSLLCSAQQGRGRSVTVLYHYVTLKMFLRFGPCCWMVVSCSNHLILCANIHVMSDKWMSESKCNDGCVVSVCVPVVDVWYSQ